MDSPTQDLIEDCLNSFEEMVEAAKNSPQEYHVQVSPAVWSDEVNSIVYDLLVE